MILKDKFQLTFLAGLLVAAVTSANAATIYSEDFDYGQTENSGMSTAGWDWAYSSSGADGDADAAGNDGTNRVPTVTGGDQLIYYTGNASIPAVAAPLFLYADNGTGDFTPYNYTDINSVQFTMDNNLGVTVDVQVALKIDNAWYVSNDTYLNTVADEVFTIDPNVDTTWNALNFTLNSTLSEGSATSLPGSGSQIQGFGFYLTGYVSESAETFRFTNITVDAVPEPSSLLLVLSAGSLLLLRRRRE